MKNKLSTGLIIAVFVAGLCLLLYPTVSDWWNSSRSSKVVANYDAEVSDLTESDYDKLFQAADDYNQRLAKNQSYSLSDEEIEEYESLLDLDGTGVMGYVEIPSINVSLPIYHGTDEEVLQIAVGHLEWTSLPVGGSSTHCVISGHRGLPSAKLFTNLDKLEIGDTFMIKVLNQTLTYEIDQILVVLPEETDALVIEEGKDLCTLVTCTPYGINDHRLLVRGHRVDNGSSSARVTSDAVQVEPLVVASVIAVPVLVILLIVLLVNKPKKRVKVGGSEDEKDFN